MPPIASRFRFPQFLAATLLLFSLAAAAQPEVRFRQDAAQARVEIRIGAKELGDFLYSDTLAKPILFPIHSPAGPLITRGFPLATRPEDSRDHPHHTGLWLNYENVNGFDFWNTSYANSEAERAHMGRILVDSVFGLHTGRQGNFSYRAKWKAADGRVFLDERTKFGFTERDGVWIIDRTTQLTALDTVRFEDAKDGMLGLRVRRELQLPTAAAASTFEAPGKKSAENKQGANLETGNYITADGASGDSAWSTRSAWCMLYGKIGPDITSVVILDDPANPGYPTYWHARGYGLFAANPLGAKIFSNGKREMHFRLEKGQTVTFHYRILIAAGKKALSAEEIRALDGK